MARRGTSRPTGPVAPRLFGERMIASAQLEAVPNPAPDRDYLISIVAPEFTCLCPRSGFPDFATIRLRYVPDHSIVELKSLKLYVNKYRDEHAFHEAAINRICDDLVACIEPRWIEVVGDFSVRGNSKTVVTVVHARPGYRPPEHLTGAASSGADPARAGSAPTPVSG